MDADLSLRRCPALLAVVLAAGSIPAQQPGPATRGGRGKLELPSPPAGQPQAKTQEPAAPAAPSAFWGPEPSRIEEVFVRFERLAEITEATVRAYLDELRGFGLGSRDTALRALASPHPPSVALAARLLEAVGKAEDADALVEASGVAGEVEAAGACLEAAARLTGGWLPERAVRLLDHPQRNLRAVAEARLQRLPHPTHVAPLLQSLRYGRDADVRVRAARLLRSFRGQEDVRAALRDGLADPSVPVSFEAAETLAGTGRPEDVAWVRGQILATPPGGEQAYLLYALLRQQQTLDFLLVDEELLPRLRVALREPDLFLSGAAAAALAEYHFRSDSEEGIGALERDVVHALVRSVAGVTFYPQYARFSPLAEASLRRITGEDFAGQDRSAWLKWLVEGRETFRAVRGVLALGPADLPRVRVTWRSGTDPARTLAGAEVAGEDLGPAGAAVRWLGPRDVERLVAALEQAGILDVQVLPGTYGPAEDEVASEVEVAAGARRKRLAFRGAAAAGWLPALLSALEDQWRGSAWQLLAATDSGTAFVQKHLGEWDAAGPEERRQLAVAWTRGRTRELSDTALEAWCSHLAAEPGLDASWNLALAAELLAEIPRRAESRAAALALLQAGLRAADASLLEPFLESAGELAEPLRSDLLLEGLLRFPLDTVAASARSDERLSVRVAALRALGRAGGAGGDVLLASLGDPNPLVVRMAVRSLAEAGLREAVPQLVSLAEPGRPKEVRKEALWALGQLGSPEGVAVLAVAARDEDAGVQLAAIGALGRVGGAAAEAAFAELFPLFCGTALEAPFLRALEGRGAGATRAVLRGHLEALDPAVARRAALHSGRLGDPAAAPFLVAMIPESPRDEELLDALAAALCADFRHTPDPAGVYTAWWRDHSRRPPAEWLAQAAAEAGITLPPGFDRREGAAAAGKALLELLETGPAYLRPAAAYYLEQVTGLDAPALYGSTPKPVVQQLAQGWRAWVESRANG